MNHYSKADTDFNIGKERRYHCFCFILTRFSQSVHSNLTVSFNSSHQAHGFLFIIKIERKERSLIVMLNFKKEKDGLTMLCEDVRHLIEDKEYGICEEKITEAMRRYPHAPQPHNLMGILLEKSGEHVKAMKHFRAAWALDPTYVPARRNMERFCNLYPEGECAFDESDCRKENRRTRYETVYDEYGVGHMVKRELA